MNYVAFNTLCSICALSCAVISFIGSQGLWKRGGFRSNCWRTKNLSPVHGGERVGADNSSCTRSDRGRTLCLARLHAWGPPIIACSRGWGAQVANEQHLAMLLRDGVLIWNAWRKNQPQIRKPDIIMADLSGAHLCGTNLCEANLNEASIFGANLSGADLRGAILSGATLSFTDLSGAILRGTDLNEARLSRANLSGADLRGVDLSEALCVSANFSHANLSDCNVYGISAREAHLEGATQTNLRIAPYLKPTITVDNLEVAQLLDCLIHSQKTRDVFDSITSKAVLILGRFGERNVNLEALREALRTHPNGYIPVLYEVSPITQRPALETVNSLANLARFVVVNLTDPNAVRSELSYITTNAPTVPVQPLIEAGGSLPAEYSAWQTHRSFLPVYRYADFDHLLANLTTHVIEPVEGHVQGRRISDDHGS